MTEDKVGRTGRKNPESWVGKTIGVSLKAGAQGVLSIDGKLIGNEEDFITLLAKTKRAGAGGGAGEQEMQIERDNILFTTLSCESAIQVAPAGVLVGLRNGH